MNTKLRELFPRVKQYNNEDLEVVRGPRGYITLKGPTKLDVVVDIHNAKTQHVVERLLTTAGHLEYKLTNDGEYLFILPHEEKSLALALIGKNGRR